MKQIINNYKAKEIKENIKDISKANFIIIYKRIIQIFENLQPDLDGKEQQGAIEFKNLALDGYNYLIYITKDAKEIGNKFFRLINIYLKKEVEEIGLKIYKNLNILVKVEIKKISEINILAYIELLKYINENSQRMIVIWNNNINCKKNQPKLAINSVKLFFYFIGLLNETIKIFNDYLNNNISQGLNYLIELKNQNGKLIESLKNILNSIKTIEKENLKDNSKITLLENYYTLINHSFYSLFIIKEKNINKDELELILYSFKFSAGNTISTYVTHMAMKYFEDIISRKNIIHDENDLEIIKNWKTYFNENTYLKNNYKSANKYNIIIKYFIKFYSHCFDKNNELFQVFKEISKKFLEDRFKMFKNFVRKLNDFEIIFEYKIQIMNCVQNFYEWNKEYTFSDLYFFFKEITSFYFSFFSLSNDYIGEHIREEKIKEKELLQKNVLKVINDNNSNLEAIIRKKNITHLFLILVSNKFDKYIYIEDENLLNEFLYVTLKIWRILIEILKHILMKENNLDQRSYMINKASIQISKFFYFYFYIYEKHKVNHQTHDINNEYIDILIDIYLNSLSKEIDLFTSVFKKLLPYIYKLYKFGNKVCPIKNCISSKIIHNIFKIIKDKNIRETLFSLYFDYFSAKIYEAGNPTEIFKNNSSDFINTSSELNESINNITILKSNFYNLLDSITNFEYFKNNIMPSIIDIIYLSKNSEYYGNYIYMLRCIFKYLQSPIQNINDNQNQEEIERKKLINSNFYEEIFYILYAIIKYLIKVKEKKPFLNDTVMEIILSIRLKNLIEIPTLIFPSLVDSLNNSLENINLNLQYLENWLSHYTKRPEIVLPLIQQNISKIIDLLSSTLYHSKSLTSLKLMSKLAGKARNYSKIKRIKIKSFPIQILSLKLKEKNTQRSMDFILDNIIGLDIDNIINYSSKNFLKKIGVYDKKIINNIIAIYKYCLSAFFHKKIDYNYIIEIKKRIIKRIDLKEFNSKFSFKIMNENNSKIKINSIFKKKEKFLIQEILKRIFLLNSSFTQFHNYQKDINYDGDNLIKFIIDYFLLILLSKEKNNKNMSLFEIDPIIIIDQIIPFVFTTNPYIIKNTNIQLTEYSIKIIIYIIDSINKFFDYNNQIIKELEIVEIIYMKFINCCYNNDSLRKDSGLILLKCLLQKFDKIINYKYLKYYFKCISNICSNYSNIIKIQLKKGSNHLLEVIDCLIKMFVINDENYFRLKEKYFENDKNINEELISDNEKKILIKAKNNFMMLFDFIKYCIDEIVEKIDSSNNYIRTIGIYFLNQILGNIPRLKKFLPILFQIDISKLTIIEFYKYFKQAYNSVDYTTILFNCNNSINITINNSEINKDLSKSKIYILKNYKDSKVYNKINIILNALTKRIDLREDNLTNLISYSDSLNNIFSVCPILISEFIIDNIDSHFKLYLEVIKSLYYNLLINYFSYLQISVYFEKSNGFKTKLIFLFIEKLLENKNMDFNFKIKYKNGEEIRLNNEVKEEYIEYIEKYIYDNDIFSNEVNTRDYLIGELYDLLGLRINMTQQYIKLLNNIYNKSYFNKNILKEKYKEEFYKYKIKITKLIFIKIFNIKTSIIIKQCSSFLYNIFRNDSKLEENIYKENYNKINDYIEKINDKNIKNSNCSINQDITSGLQKNHINALLIICKSMNLPNSLLEEITKKIFIFENHFNEKKYENNQFVLFYGYICIFLYIKAEEATIKLIFKFLLNRIKESFLNESKHLLLFTQTSYHKKIVKLIIKYRTLFSKFIIEMHQVQTDRNYILKFIKILDTKERNAIIFEQLFNDIVYKIKNEIIINNHDSNIRINSEVNKLAYFLKICKIISLNSPTYLRKSKLIEIIDGYMKKIIINYDNNYEQLQENSDYEKIMKYWIELISILIRNFKNKNKYLMSFFFFLSRKNVPEEQKNKIAFFLEYNILLVFKEKNYEKFFKNIINYFIKFDEETAKYFDLFTEYLIIPMTIRYLKNIGYFKCFSVYLNKDNSLKINFEAKNSHNCDKSIEKKKKENNAQDNNNGKKLENNNITQIDDEQFILYFLETITLKLNNIILDDEKKENAKYKLLSLLIVIYLEYINKKENNINYNCKTTNIYYNIQTLLSNSPYTKNKETLGLWRIYLMLDICLFSEQNENESNITTIFDFNKYLDEDYNDIENLEYELVLPKIQDKNLLEKILKSYYSELIIINFSKIILKFPNIVNKLSLSFLKIITNGIYELFTRLGKNNTYKKLLIQIIGLITSFISKQREELVIDQNNENLEVKNIYEIEKWIFDILFNLLYFIINDDNEKPDIDILQKLLLYFKEITNSKTNIEMQMPNINSMKFNYKTNYIIIQLLRIFILNAQIETIYKNLDYYNKYYNIMNENRANSRYFNDIAFIFRCLTDEKILIKINNKQKPNKRCFIEYKLKMMKYIDSIIKGQNNMSKKYTNYDIKDIFIVKNNNYDFIIKNVKNYLILNRLFFDIDILNNYQNNNINQQNLPTTNITTSDYRRPQQNQYTDKWLESFRINDFKYFIFIRKFIFEFYTSLPETIKNIDNLEIKEENKDNIIQSLKIELDKRYKEQNENIEIIQKITYSFLENFYCFTIFFLREYKIIFDKMYRKIYLNKEIKDYFNTSHNFFFNLKDFDDLQKIKNEDFDYFINDKDNNNPNINLLNNMLMFYPDIILSGFYFFFDCKEIAQKYYNHLLDLFIYTYRFFRDKFYDELFEYLLNKILFNEYLKDKFEEKNVFIFKLLKSIDLINTNRIIKTSENISNIIIKYLKYYLTIPNTNKKDPNLNKSLRIILYNSIKFELKNRQNFFELLKCYTGSKITDSLKWLFTLEDFDNDIYSYIYFESITISIEFLLSHFQEGIPLMLNTNNYSHFKNMENNVDDSMQIEINHNDYKEYDKNNFIKNIVDNCNSITRDNKKVENLLDPIKAIILSENSFCYKLFTSTITQIWKMLSMTEREELTVYFNEFFYKFTSKVKDKRNQIINLLLDTCSQCTPLIYIKPLVIKSLIPYNNFWTSNVLYLENLLISGIDVPINYNLLINIFNSLHENGLSNGLKYFFSIGKESKEAFSQLQRNDYLSAENIFYKCFNELKSDILDKININILNDDKNISLSNDNFDFFCDLSSWENGLIECYENSGKWNNIIELSNLNNNYELKVKGLWFLGYENWKYLNDFSQTTSQFNNQEEYYLKIPAFVQINEIYSNFDNIIEDINSNKETLSKYQVICKNCIQKIYHDYNLLFPKNVESLTYYYYLIFQLNFEAWESANILQEVLKKVQIEKKEPDFKENLLLWRERLPHYCEGIQSIKNVLEPRNYLFSKLIQKLSINNNNYYIPYNIDKAWNDMIYIKYLRKLNLTEKFYEKLKLFDEEYKNKNGIFPYEIYCKDKEYLKFIRNNIYNYDLGIKVCDKNIYNYSLFEEETSKDLFSYAINEFKGYKAYFYYKQGNIYEAHKLFMESSINDKNKETTNYHLYSDWAEMCEEISFLIKDEEECSQWFENTIFNYLYTIIYKLDKAKFIIPRMITFIKDFPNQILKERFNEEINQISSWVWIFYLPVLFETLNFYEGDENKNDFFFIILKKVANIYKQIIYYPYNIYKNYIKKDSLKDKYNELKKIIYSENKYDHCMDKIQLIIDELTKKENENQEYSLNTILNFCEMQTFKNQKFSEVKTLFGQFAVYLRKYPDLVQFKNAFEDLMKSSEITRNKIRECIIKSIYYNHNLITTQNKFHKISKLCEENIYNIDYNNIELPGYFSNKIEEPTKYNKIYISKFESEYDYKFITDARSKVLIRCSNDKILNFIIVKKDADKNVDMEIYMMQILFNFIFAKNYQTYKRKILFLTPIKYPISSKIKIVEEDINTKYNMNEIYEYCLQKRGYSPKIANQIFEEEAKKLNVNTDLVYYSSENNEKLFYKMCKIIPQDSLKNFIHKFLLTSEDILIFRRQFSISYSLNNLFNFIVSDNILLKNISFNKENGFCLFNFDLQLFNDNNYNELMEQMEGTSIRLSKNISFFLSITSIYGIIPEVFYFSCDSLLNKSKNLKSIFKISLNNHINNKGLLDKIVNNYINKIQIILNNNLFNDKNDESKDNNDNDNTLNKSIEQNTNNNMNKECEGFDNRQKSLKIIYELIDNSMNNDNLKKKNIDFEAWF